VPSGIAPGPEHERINWTIETHAGHIQGGGQVQRPAIDAKYQPGAQHQFGKQVNIRCGRKTDCVISGVAEDGWEKVLFVVAGHH
jgi:hypothetical protein